MEVKYQNVDPSSLDQFLSTRPYSVIHLDAPWNGQRIPVQERINALTSKLDDTSFGYIDVDVHQSHARSVPVKNVPTCCYYRGSELVAAVVGMQQNIEFNLQIVRDGGTPDTSNHLSRK